MEVIMDQQEQVVRTGIPSLYYVKCPKCGSSNFIMVGQTGAKGKSIGMSLAFGAVGSLANAHAASGRDAVEPLQYQCKDCKEKFVAGPLEAAPDELLSAPATISVERVKSFVGMAVPQVVFVNGVKVGELLNGRVVTFQTPLRFNTLVVTDHFGVAFKTGTTRFEVQPGGAAHFRFNRKYV
jgi:DNA-directed RNA polymerase subunit RPC12/RpoP